MTEFNTGIVSPNCQNSVEDLKVHGECCLVLPFLCDCLPALPYLNQSNKLRIWLSKVFAG